MPNKGCEVQLCWNAIFYYYFNQGQTPWSIRDVIQDRQDHDQQHHRHVDQNLDSVRQLASHYGWKKMH